MICVFLLVGAHCQTGAERVKDETTLGKSHSWFLSWINCKVQVKVAQSCPTLCNPMDYTVYGILQAKILQWVTFPFSRGSTQPRDRTQVSHIEGGFFTS